MDTHSAILSQYQAALLMLKAAVEQCPPRLWADPAPANQFWHIAYHALFYAHLYIQPAEADFVAWAGHRPEYNFMGPLPWPPHALPAIDEPYQPDEILTYLAFCQAEVDRRVPLLDLAAPSGFYWLAMTKHELLLYELRHLMLHIGELADRLGNQAQIDVPWVGLPPGRGEVTS